MEIRYSALVWVSKHPAIIGVILVLVIGALVVEYFSADLLACAPEPEPEPEYNLRKECAEEKKLPLELIAILEPLGTGNQSPQRVYNTIDELSTLGEYLNDPLIYSTLSSVVHGGITLEE